MVSLKTRSYKIGHFRRETPRGDTKAKYLQGGEKQRGNFLCIPPAAVNAAGQAGQGGLYAPLKGTQWRPGGGEVGARSLGGRVLSKGVCK